MWHWLALSLVLIGADSARTDTSDYLAAFALGVEALEEDRFAEAERHFRSAGTRSPAAPVWRVHAAVAAAGGGDAEAALLLAREALAAGYPPSDLAAICSARGLELMPPDGANDPVHLDGMATVVHAGQGRVKGNEPGRIVGGRVVTSRAAWDLSDGSRHELDAKREAVIPIEIPGQVAAMEHQAVSRGLRTGLWCAGGLRPRVPLFVTGTTTVSFLAPSYQRVAAETLRWPTTLVDVESLTTSLLPETLASPTSRIQDPALRMQLRFRAARITGEGLGSDVVLHRVADLPYTVMVHMPPLDGVPRDFHPLSILDLEAGAVVAHPEIEPGFIFGVRAHEFVYDRDTGLLFTSNPGGATLEAISTDTWTVAWRVPWQSSNGHDRRMLLRGDRIFSSTVDAHLSDVHVTRTGEHLFNGAPLDLHFLDGTADHRWAVGSCRDSFALLDGETFRYLLSFWIDEDDTAAQSLVVVGADTTFHAEPRVLRSAHVVVAGAFVPAATVAPWLWDPLHLRSLRHDAEPRLRRVRVHR